MYNNLYVATVDMNKVDKKTEDKETDEKWETDEEILRGDSKPPYDNAYAMQKWAGYGFPEGYMAKGCPEKYARRRRIYQDYLNGLRPRGDKTRQGNHQITLRKFQKDT